MSRAELAGLLSGLRRDSKKIVFTNGCFDILHIGHLRYLQEARQLGDLLVVGLNSDDSVRRLKGANRPFVPEFERAEMLAGLSCVDYITVFDEPTAIDLIRLLKPDVYAKGGDISAEQVPERDAVISCGGMIEILSLVEGHSTTNLASRVRSAAQVAERAGEKKRIVGMIPARLASTRLPNKPLLEIAGKPMIQWVYEHASAAQMIDEVIVATPDREIFDCVTSFSGKAEMTSYKHRSGTDRLEEVARKMQGDLIVNIQGDEPLLDPTAVDLLAQSMIDSPDASMGSLMCLLEDQSEANDPAVVKVVTDSNNYALYFSRSEIPYKRNPEGARTFKHIGIYAYRWHFLLSYATMPPSPLETTESLEQLRALENGHKIKMVETDFSPTSVDTPEDLERVRAILSKGK